MAKGQVPIIYLILTIAIAFVLAAGVFLFARVLGNNISGDLAEVGLDSVGQQLENSFLDLKIMADGTNESSVNMTIKIPKQIGEQRYFIAGHNSRIIELRTTGNPSIPKNLEMKFWPDLKVNGFVDSSQGFIEMQLNDSNKVLIK